MTNKKGISPVITTVLLIVIAIAAVAIVATFVIPYIESVQDKGECFKSIDQIKIDTTSKYTCYSLFEIDPDSTPASGDEYNYAVLNVTISRGSEELGIEEFIITVAGGGTSETFDIKQGPIGASNPDYSRVFMMGSANPHIIEIPKRREQRTYSLNTTLKEVTSVNIAPVVKGNIFCDAVDKQEVGIC